MEGESKMQKIDLRSDTITHPTPEMRAAMAQAEVGDDGYGEDPSIRCLEERAADLLGKESALFIPTGTFGNQLALFTHCDRGDEVILEDNCHIVANEMGAAGVVSGVQLRTIASENGLMSPAEICSRIRRVGGLHSPRTGLICLENVHSLGEVLPLEYMEEVYALAGRYGIPVHLDGARLFNAALALKTEPREIACFADTVMFCLSKGLCAPVGSLLAGSASFIESARRKRQIMGGGMRQAGVLAAPGLIALERMRDRLNEDHENARLLESLLSEISQVYLKRHNIPANIVFFRVPEDVVPAAILVRELHKRGIIINPPQNSWYRLITHYGISADNIRCVASSIAELIVKYNQQIMEE